MQKLNLRDYLRCIMIIPTKTISFVICKFGKHENKEKRKVSISTLNDYSMLQILIRKMHY